MNQLFSNFPLLLIISGLILLSQGCKDDNSESEISTNDNEQLDSLERQELLREGKEIAAVINTALIGELTKAIGERGFEGAVDFCSIHAIPITDSISKAKDVEIKRISHKARNDDNEASEQELQIMDQFREMKKHAEGGVTPVILSENGKNTFYAPIFIASPLCLNCHGKVDSDIKAVVYSNIQQKYPNDKATGFEMNDLRGMLRIEFKNK